MSLIQPVEAVERVPPGLRPSHDGGVFTPFGGYCADAEPLGEVNIRTLPPGTALMLETTNSLYRVVLQDEPGVAMLQGGTRWPSAVPVFIVGSRGRGIGRLHGVIAVGLRMEFLVDGERVLTSGVRHITVTPREAD